MMCFYSRQCSGLNFRSLSGHDLERGGEDRVSHDRCLSDTLLCLHHALMKTSNSHIRTNISIPKTVYFITTTLTDAWRVSFLKSSMAHHQAYSMLKLLRVVLIFSLVSFIEFCHFAKQKILVTPHKFVLYRVSKKNAFSDSVSKWSNFFSI